MKQQWMAHIPSGDFKMGCEERDDADVHVVYLDDFYMDKYLVTNAQYREFIEATGRFAHKNWDIEDGNRPVIGVDWYDAMAYAEWIGKRLPTEAEWEKAARGGLTDGKYPWGDENPDRGRVQPGYSPPMPVGSYPPNGYGLYDMVGNVWQWCLDEYHKDFYRCSARRNPLAGGPLAALILNYEEEAKIPRVIRGDSGVHNPNFMQVAYRFSVSPGGGVLRTGFRCVSPRFL